MMLAVLSAILLAACTGAPPFDPTGPCTADGSAPGAYPDLEAAVPKLYNGAAPAELDSGRACTATGLGTLTSHGVKELHFAGGTWSTGDQSGISLAVFTDPSGPTLEAAWMAEFFETGARAGKNVTSVESSDYPLGGDIAAKRIDVLNGESYQTVLVWPRDGRVAVTLVGNFIRDIQTKEAHERVVEAAVRAWTQTLNGG